MLRIDNFTRFVFPAKVVALLTVLALAPWMQSISRLNHFLSIDRYLPAAIFLFVTAVCLVALVVTPFLQRNIVRVPLVLLLLGSCSIEQLYIALSGQHLDATAMETLWREKAMADTAASAYWGPALRTTGWIIPAAVILAWRPTPPVIFRTVWAILPVVAFLSCFAVMKRTINGTSEFPSAFRLSPMLAVAALSEKYSGPRNDVASEPAPKPQFRKIVMIVDESVRGDYLEINDTSKKSTPFLTERRGQLINFGPAVAAHNCSAAARLILRAGLRSSDLPDVSERAFKNPTIWQYAQKAGFETVLVDAFANVISTHSYMTKVERGFIDRTIPVGGAPDYMRDQTIAAQILPRILATEKRLFVYVNKYGSHFPYRAAYPADFGGSGTAPLDNLEDRSELQESYRRAVRWSVDEFFRTLLGGIDLKDTLIIYTSDHGQSLLEGGYRLTHCSTTGKVHPGEGIVPLFALSDAGDFGQALKQAAQAGFGNATHFNVFPTLLLAMGYEASWVARRYDASLLRAAENTKRHFLVGDMFGTYPGGNAWIAAD